MRTAPLQTARRRRPAKGFAAALAVLPALLAGTARAQSVVVPLTPYVNRNLVVLDPGHGGPDNGATLSDHTPEKNATLALAASLRSALTARGLTVVATRDADLPAGAPALTSDQRAGIANHLHPAACLLLHATPNGNGVHLITSDLPPSDVPYNPSATLSWASAQTLYLPQSRSLANAIGLNLQRARLPLVLLHADIPPIDNLTCAAVLVEIAPLTSGSTPTPVTDSGYQQRIVQAVTTALVAWRDRALPPPASGVRP